MSEAGAMQNHRILSALLIASLAIAAAGPLALEAAAPGPCEKALYACFSAPGNNLPWNIIACLQGYDFCKRFVEPLLSPQT
jgi:hypothetical protein